MGRDKYIWIKDGGKYRPEHRVVMERKLGRKLSMHEIVHHINGNKLDNRPENLTVMTREEHTSMHHTGLKHIRRKIGYRPHNKLSDAKIAKIKELHSKGWNFSDIASSVGVSDQTCAKYAESKSGGLDIFG